MSGPENDRPAALNAWCPSVATLEHWTRRDWTDGLSLDEVGPTTLYVRTRNSLYGITVLSRETREVIVQGGQFFPKGTRAVLAGSTLGGAFLKVGGIYVGFRLELHHGRQRIVTSPIVSIRSAWGDTIYGRRGRAGCVVH